METRTTGIKAKKENNTNFTGLAHSLNLLRRFNLQVKYKTLLVARHVTKMSIK